MIKLNKNYVSKWYFGLERTEVSMMGNITQEISPIKLLSSTPSIIQKRSLYGSVIMKLKRMLKFATLRNYPQSHSGTRNQKKIRSTKIVSLTHWMRLQENNRQVKCSWNHDLWRTIKLSRRLFQLSNRCVKMPKFQKNTQSTVKVSNTSILSNH